ncbi:large proline-rich protein BAG6 [Thrips palmi]|uniref:Large proline-rich protein BAG6 n=1 Tax=Thrips palmi TaxID=161013 RepID=A0A6P8Y958_THRPL|nr:large proline-rich protein BAG6 [Thrips palmi]XP_034233211.1 large proline-rich protein BAG6 [Thrips palmi]
MIDLTVKTLDSRNHAFSMPDDASVQQLKAKIEETMNIPASRQRLIFHGRVMQDDKRLSEYEVHGMVIHLVKSQPPQPGARQGSNSNASGSNNTNASDGSGRQGGPRYFGRVDGGTMFGSVVIPVLGDPEDGRHRASRLILNAYHMIDRATEVLDNYESSVSRSDSSTASVTTTPYNSSRDSSGSHSPTTDPTQLRTGAPSGASSQPSTSSSVEGGDSEMETDSTPATPHITVSNADQATGSSTASSNTTSGTGTGTATPDGTSQNSSQPRHSGTPTAANMAELLSQLREVQARVNPLLIRYHNLFTNDPPTTNARQLARRQKLSQAVPEVLHLLSHAYHAVSDLTTYWDRPPPRQMRPLQAPAIQQLVQLTEGMNPWGVNIPGAALFAQQSQPATSNASATTGPGATRPSTVGAAAAAAAGAPARETGAAAFFAASAAAAEAAANAAVAARAAASAAATAAAAPGSTSTAAAASPGAAAQSGVPEMTYMTTTFPAEGGEATTTFSTRPATNFEAAPGTNNSSAAPGAAGAANRTPVVTASIDLSGRNPGLTAALNVAYAIANRFAAHQVGHPPHQQQPQQQSQQPNQPQQPQQSAQQQQAAPDQPQQPPQQPPLQPPLHGQARAGIVHLPVGMIDANVEFFMEVGPSTITIDSVEASVVTSNNFTPGTNGAPTDGNPLNVNFPWGGPHPQEFLHGVVQALNRFMTPGAPGAPGTPGSPSANPNLRRRGSAPESTPNPNLRRRGSAPETEGLDSAQSQASSASASAGNAGNAAGNGTAAGQTSQARGYTATHPTTSTQTRSTARPHVHHIAATQFPGYSVAYPMDPFLPCHSHFFAPWRRSRPSGNTGTSTTANSATQTSTNSQSGTQATAPTPQPNSGRPASTSTASPAASGPAASATSASTSTQGSPGASFLNFIQSLFGRDMPAGNDALTSVIESLVTASNQGDQAEVPIINWMFPGANEQAGESLLADLRLAVVRSVTVSDLAALIDSNWDAVNHIRTDLRQFVIERLCQGTLTQESFAQGVNQMLEELRPYFNIILEGEVREDVDPVATLYRYHQTFLPIFFKLILDDDRAPNFGRNLHALVHKYLGRLWAIVKYCCANNEAVEAVFTACMNRMSEEGSLSTWTARAYLGQLRLYTDSISVPFQEIEKYIVYRGGANGAQDRTVPVPSTSESSSSSESAKSEEPNSMSEVLSSSVLQGNIEPMDMDPQSPPLATTSAVASSDIPCHSSEESAPVAPSGEASSGDIGELASQSLPVPAPEAWHRILPPEWVPIIARDATRQQRRPNSQAPLSDAYLAGMPPKRRKVVTADKPQGSLSEVIAANMESAIQSSGVSTAGLSLVQEEAGSDPRLREAYREQLRATVRANLANNPDFSAERFPNAAQYFGKS